MAYWYAYLGRGVTREDVDWSEILGGRPERPFDAHVSASWYGLFEFSLGSGEKTQPVPRQCSFLRRGRIA
jgi:hypothetical protein